MHPLSVHLAVTDVAECVGLLTTFDLEAAGPRPTPVDIQLV
jgi:hypothetical protein